MLNDTPIVSPPQAATAKTDWREAVAQYRPQPELLDTALWGFLYSGPNAANGSWIPTWIIRAVNTEARAKALSQILWWFEPAHADRRRIEQRPGRGIRQRARARVYDALGIQWYATTGREFARRTMLPQRTAVDALNWLASHGFVDCTEVDGSVWLRPNATVLAGAFYELSKEQTAHDEFLASRPLCTDWMGSGTQMLACHRAVGVTVHHVLVAVAGGNLFLGRLLSQIVSRFGDRKRKVHAKVRIAGNLWWVESASRWAAELGVSEKTTERGVGALRTKGLVRTMIHPWGNQGGQTRLVTHVRPDVDSLLSRVTGALAEQRQFSEKIPQQEKIHERATKS